MSDDLQNYGGAAFQLSAQSRGHIQTLTVLYWVLAGLGLVSVVVSLVSGPLQISEMRDSMQTGPPGPAQAQQVMDGIMYLTWAFMACGLILSLLFTLAAVHNAISIRRGQRRTLCLICAAVLCLSIPFGTGLGIYTFVVMGHDEMREFFERGGLDSA